MDRDDLEQIRSSMTIDIGRLVYAVNAFRELYELEKRRADKAEAELKTLKENRNDA